MPELTQPDWWHPLVPVLMTLLLTVALLPVWMRWQQQQVLGQAIREDGPASHQVKSGTPTAGGLCMLVAWSVAVLASGWFLAGQLLPVTWLLVGVTLVLGVLGLVDDLLKMAKKHNKGVNGYTKLAVQIALGLGLGGFVWATTRQASTNVLGWQVPLGWLYPLFTAWVLTAFSNAVNLTDGVDGLAASTLTMSFMLVGLLIWQTSPWLGVPLQLSIPALAAVGALVGFWFFNRHPAQIFMGDTGSLAFGGLLAALGILARMEWWLLGFGLLFVLEALSVCVQVASFKLFGRRVLRMSPLHHHFELGGWNEVTIVRVFVMIQLVGCVAALLLLPALLY